MTHNMIAILDLGSTQSAQIARDIRALGVYSEIHPNDIAPAALKALPGIAGVILNGGENRVVDGAPAARFMSELCKNLENFLTLLAQ